MIIKPLSAAEDIQAAALADATALAGTLLWVVNTKIYIMLKYIV